MSSFEVVEVDGSLVVDGVKYKQISSPSKVGDICIGCVFEAEKNRDKCKAIQETMVNCCAKNCSIFSVYEDGKLNRDDAIKAVVEQLGSVVDLHDIVTLSPVLWKEGDSVVLKWRDSFGDSVDCVLVLVVDPLPNELKYEIDLVSYIQTPLFKLRASIELVECMDEPAEVRAQAYNHSVEVYSEESGNTLGDSERVAKKILNLVRSE